METSFESKCNILSELWLNYRDNASLKDFVDYNDLALPLSFMIAEEIVSEPGHIARSYIEETFNVLLATVKIEDTGFEELAEILDAWGIE